MTNDLEQRIAALTPEQRILFEQRLMEHARRTSAYRPIPARSCGDRCPLSFAQERLWFLDQLEPNVAVYNIDSAYQLTGLLDVEALRRALTWLVERHEVLRTVYTSREGEPIQVVYPPRDIELPTIDLTGLPAEESEQAVVDFLNRESSTPFDLQVDLMLRARLARLAPDSHLFLLTVHHIASDGWSTGVIHRELAHAYNAYRSGGSPTLPPLPIQYADFAVWQREWLQGDALKQQVEYWRRQLEDVPLFRLQPDRARPRRKSYRGAAAPHHLSPDLADRLRRLSRETGNTLYMLLLAAFQALLYRYSDQTDIAVGAILANRNRSELEGLIGYFANTLVMRSRVRGDLPFRAFLQEVNRTALEAYSHQDLPFERLVAELQPERDLGQNPLVEIVFQMLNAPGHGLMLHGLEVEKRQGGFDYAKFDLSLSVSEARGGLRIHTVYATDLFEPSTIEQLQRHYEQLLRGIVDNPDQQIARLPLLDATEAQLLLRDWNATERPFPGDTTIHALFEAQAARAPKRTAISHGVERVSYGELNRRANALARYLRGHGVGPEVAVGLCVARSPLMVVAMLAVLKAGGYYVPIDPTFPALRIQFMLQDAGARLLLSFSQIEQELQREEFDFLILDEFDFGVGAGAASGLESEADGGSGESVGGENLAYAMYTSGSTGRPKGVAVPHRAVLRLVCNADYVQIHPDDVIAQVSNIAFDAATFEIWGALLHGAEVAIIDRETVLSPPRFGEELRARRVSKLFVTTALFNQIVRDAPHTLAAVDTVLFGGEAVDASAVAKLLAHGPPKRLLHVYGPTETTTFATWWEVRAEDAAGMTVPIGRPIANTRVYLLDRAMQPVPVGVTGEVYIGGPGLARGYLNDAALTAEKFVADPFSGEAGARLYRTGDLARQRRDGAIEFVGRADHQVKLRGFRIELGEIEAVLVRHPQVEAALVGVRRVGEDRRLAAYIVPVKGASVGTYELRDFLQRSLPAYMIPADFMSLPALPISPTGKVDRAALPEFADGAEATIVEPRTPLEERVAAMIAAAVGRPHVEIYDNFFEIGGHSLLASRLVARIRNDLKVNLSLRSLFETPTAAGLAAQVEQLLGRRTDRSSSESAQGFVSLVEVKKGAPGLLPFFLVPGGGGSNEELLTYANLIHLLGPDQPVYALLARGLDGKLPPHKSMGSMVEDYVAEMRALQPRGPYLVGGECTGGKVAFEIARRLTDAGEEVGLLALLDTFLSPSERKSKNPWQMLLSARTRRRARHHLRRIRGMSPRGWFGYLLERLAGRLPLAANGNGSPGQSPQSKVQELRVMHHYQQLVVDYFPAEVYPGKLTLFVSDHRNRQRVTSAWMTRAGDGMEIHQVAGDHYSYLGEHVQDTAGRLRLCLEQAQTASKRTAAP